MLRADDEKRRNQTGYSGIIRGRAPMARFPKEPGIRGPFGDDGEEGREEKEE
jgi:hypothetical protein